MDEQESDVMKSKVLLLLLCLWVLPGCGNPYASEFTRSEPRTADLVGVWRVDVANSFLPDELSDAIINSQAVVTLNADGTFEATGLPLKVFGLLEHDSDRPHTTGNLAGHGSWTIKKKQDQWWIVGLHWETRNDVTDDVYGGLGILNQSPEYLLHHTWSDPDLGYAVAFTRDHQNSEP